MSPKNGRSTLGGLEDICPEQGLLNSRFKPCAVSIMKEGCKVILHKCTSERWKQLSRVVIGCADPVHVVAQFMQTVMGDTEALWTARVTQLWD